LDSNTKGEDCKSQNHTVSHSNTIHIFLAIQTYLA